MSYYSNQDNCLPKNGLLIVADLKAAYTVSYGSYLSLHRKNCVYDEDGYYISLDLNAGAAMGHQLVAAALVTGNAFPAIRRIQLNNESEGPRTRGHYVLLDLATDPRRLKNTRKVILFIAHTGGTYQDFGSNNMESDEEVTDAFEKLKTEQAAVAA